MLKPKVVIGIPARMGASRFPGKPLAQILSLPMIEHVRRRSSLVKNVEVYVATCDQIIKDTVESNGGKAIMTSPSHERCTDRIQEMSKTIFADFYIMVQGDEPLVHPSTLEQIIEELTKGKGSYEVVNVIHPIKKNDEKTNPNVVKVTISNNQKVLYMSRATIPGLMKQDLGIYYKQSGIIGFSREALNLYNSLESTCYEVQESIDMLRFLQNDIPIKALIIEEDTRGVDDKTDIKIVEDMINNDIYQKQIYKKILEEV